MYINDQQSDTGNFIQQTPLFDIGRLYTVDFASDDFKELLVQLCQQVNNIAISLNNKVNGYNLDEEFVNGDLFFPAVGNSQLDLRPGYTKIIYLTSLPAGVTTVPHGIAVDANVSFYRLLGVANDTIGFNYYGLGWPSAAGATNIELRATNTDIVITNNSGVTFNKIYITLKYLKS